jgi:hypothetical protein
MSLLRSGEHQPWLAVAPAAIGFDGYRFHIEKQQDAAARPVLPQLPEPVEDMPAVSILVPKLARDAAEAVPPFLSTRRRCSRLIAETIRWRRR